MRRAVWSVAMMTMVLTAVVGCQTMTGRTARRHFDDNRLTGEVKTKLSLAHLSNLTRVDVETVNGVVYLQGVVDDSARKAQAGQIAQAVRGVRHVVNDLDVKGETRPTSEDRATSPSASPATQGDLHTVTGDITDIDRDKGLVTVKTADQTMDLRFPPSMLQNVQKGQRVTIAVGIRPAP